MLAAAVRCHASVIVTFNEADFPKEALDVLGIHTCHPDQFVRNVDDLDSGTLIEAAKIDFAHYQNPPLTAEQYSEGLRTVGLPMTAKYLERMSVLLTS